MASRPEQDIYAETLAVFDRGDDPFEPRTTPEVADALGANRRTVYKRLQTLADRGELKTKSAGARARVWWRPVPEDPPGTSPERERERELERYEAVVQSIDDGVYVCDGDGRFVLVNDAFVALSDRRREELVGVHGSTVFGDGFVTAGAARWAELRDGGRDAIEFQTELDRVDDDPVVVEIRSGLVDLGDEVGRVGVVRDVHERRARERKLEESRRRYRTLVDNFPNGAVALVDEALRYVTVGGTPMEEAVVTPEQIEGSHVREVVPPAIADAIVPRYDAAIDGEPSSFDGQVGERHYQFTFVPVRDERGDVFAAMGMSQDITEHKRRERELERYETIVETVTDGIVVVDADDRIRAVNGAFADTTGYPRERLVGAPASLVRPVELEDRMAEVQASLEAGTDTEIVETTILPADAEPFPSVTHFARITLDDGTAGRVGVLRDISEQVERERRLEQQLRQQEVVTALGQQALGSRDLDDVMAVAAELVADTLDNDYCKVMDLEDGSEVLRLRQGVGWHDGVVGSATVSAVEDDSQAAYTLASRHPVVVEDLATESRFDGPELLTSHGVRSGISTIIGSYKEPWGVIGTHDTAAKEFSENDVNFVGAVANILATAINRRDHERALARQREQLAALDDLNRVGREITDAVIEQSTREEIEQVVCEQLAASDSYAVAWIADIDQRTERIRPRAEAGADGVPERIGHGAESADRFASGPVREAFRTGEMAVARDVLDDPELEHWRDAAERYGFRSVAAIPVAYGDVLYGVIGVHSEHADGFGAEERAVVEQLGEVVGHAISGVEQKQALMSDSITEVELKIRDVFETYGVPMSAEGTVRIDRAVPIGDDRHLVYGTATGGAMDVVTALVEAESVPRWESVTVLRSDDAATHFELKLAESLVISTVAAHGGYIEETVIEGSDCYVKFHLASGTDVQGVVTQIMAEFPDVVMVMRRQRTRAERYPERMMEVLSEGLTDRQQAALEAGYFAGFFDYPRDCSGEDVARALDVSSSTFHQHVRKAQKTLLDVVFADA